MTDTQMKLFVWVTIAAFAGCGVSVFWPPLLPYALALAGVVFAVYVASVLIRTRTRDR